MRELAGVRHKLHVDGLREIGLPVIGGTRKEHQSEEDVGEHSADGQGSERTAAPAFRGRGSFARRERELKSILCGTNRDACHAGGAFNCADLDELVDGEAGRACL